MKAQFFIISSVIMIYVIVLTFQYLTGFSDIRLSGVEEHQELSYISKIKNSFIQTLNTSNYSNSGDMNKIVKDIDFAKNFFKQELLKKGINFDSKFIFFSNGFESNDLSDWSGVYGAQILNGTAYNGINSLYSNGIQYVTKNLSGVSEVFVRTYVNFNTLPSNPNKYYFMDLYENSNQILGLGLWNDNGIYKLIVYSNSFSDPWISPAISIGNGEWHYFELYWLENGTNSVLKSWYDGQLEIASQAIASGGKGKLINQYNFGGANAVGGTPDLYVDCVAISSDYVGDKCYPDEQNYFDFTLKTNGLYTETEFPYQEKIIPNPIWFNNFVNNTLAGQPTLFSLNWTDVVGLSGYIFSFDNCTGSLVNDTAWVPMIGLSNFSSVVKTISSSVGCTIRWQFYANDTSGKWNASYIFSLTITTTYQAPQYWLKFVNNTLASKPTLFSLNWTDDIGLSGYIFSTNNSGTWQNDSFVNFNFTPPNAMFSDDFESGGSSAWTTVNGGSVVSNDKYHGTYSYKTTNAGQYIAIIKDISSFLPKEVYMRFYYKIESDISNPGDEWYISHDGIPRVSVRIVNIGGNLKWRLGITRDDWIEANYTASTGPIPGQWYSVEYWYKNNTAQGAKLWINGVLTLTSETTVYTIPLWWMSLRGYSVSTNPTIPTQYFDDVVISNSYIGPETTSWSNVTKTLNAAVGIPIGWCVYANDISNSWNGTSCVNPFSFATTGTPLQIQFVSPTDNNGAAVSRNWSYVNVSITDASSTSSFIDWNRSLVGYWSMDWYNSTGVFDNSTWNNFGTFQNGLGTGSITAGQYGRGIAFDGINDYYINAGNPTVNGTFSVEAWAKVLDTADRTVVGTRAPSDYGFDFKLQNGNRIHGDIGNGAAWITISADASFNYQLNIWYHIVYVVTPTSYTIYVNGSQVGSGTYSQNNPVFSDSSHSIAVGSNQGYEHFNGTIDEVRVWNRTLSPEEINASYNSGINRLYHNFTNLTSGVYQYYAYAIDINGNANKTETRTITLSPFNGNLWLKFNEASGIKAFDSSSYGNNGTYYGETFNDGILGDGACSPGFGSCPNRVNGYYGKALGFDGASDYVNIPYSAGLNTSNEITAAVWIKPANVTACPENYGQTIIASSPSLGNYNYWFYLCNGNLGLTAYSTTYPLLTVPNVIPTSNIWYHLAFTAKKAGIMNIYLNGNPIASGNADTNFSEGVGVTIGDLRPGRGLRFNGTIDEVRIWNRTLTLAEINNEMNSYLPVNRPVASYSFEESGSYVNDTHIWVNGTYGSALSFDGINDYVSATNIPVNTSLGANNTVTFWMYWNGGYNPDWSMPFSWNSQYDIGFNNNGYFGFNTYNSDIWGISSSGLSNKWAHIAAIFYNGDGKVSRLFINGTEQVLSQRMGTTGSKSVSNFPIIGSGSSSSDYFFGGIIDEVRIWNRTLTQAEIQAEMYKG